MQLTNDFNLKEIENNVKDYLSKIDLKKIIANSHEKNERIMFLDVRSRIKGLDLNHKNCNIFFQAM